MYAGPLPNQPIGPPPNYVVTVGVPKSAPQDKVPSAATGKLASQDRLTNDLIKIIKNSGSSYEKGIAKSVWAVLTRAEEEIPAEMVLAKQVAKENKPLLDTIRPDLQKAIAEFESTHKEIIDILKGPPPKDWKKWIPELEKQEVAGDPTARPMLQKLTEFRKAAVTFQDRLAHIAAKGLGIPPGDWEALGTVALKSDIDRPFLAEKGTSEADKILVKQLADTGWAHVMQGLSGTQLDLERYLEHGGKTLDVRKELLTKEAVAEFNFQELKMAYLDMRRSYGADHGGWEAFKKSEKENASPGLCASLERIFVEVETFEQEVNREIEAQMKGEEGEAGQLSDLRERAAMTLSFPRMIALSEQLDKMQAELNELRSKLVTMKPMDISRKRVEQQCDELVLNIAEGLALRNAFFEGTYLAQGPYLVIVEKQQLEKTIAKKLQKEGAVAARTVMDTPAVLSQTAERQRMRPIAPRVFTAEDQVANARENLSKLKSKYLKYENASKGKTNTEQSHMMEHFAVEGSKYAERTLAACREVLNKMRESLSKEADVKSSNARDQIAQVEAACKQADKLYQKADDLEKAKRQDVLSLGVARKLLMGALEAERKVSEEEASADAKSLTMVLELFEPDGQLADPNLTVRQKYNQALNACLTAGIVKPDTTYEALISTVLEKVENRCSVLAEKLIKDDKKRVMSPDDVHNLIQFTLEQAYDEALKAFVDVNGVEPRKESESEIQKVIAELERQPGLGPKLFRRLSPSAQQRIVQAALITKVQPLDLLAQAVKGVTAEKVAARVYAKIGAAINQVEEEELKGTLHPVERRKSAGQAPEAVVRARTSLAEIRKGQMMQKLEESEAKERLFLKRVKEVLYKDLPEESLLTSSNPHFDAIFRARAGFPRELDNEVNKIHHGAETVTLGNLGLTSAAAVREYFKQTEEINKDMLELAEITKLFVLPPPRSARVRPTLLQRYRATDPGRYK